MCAVPASPRLVDMTITVTGHARNRARGWWPIGTVLVANGALVTAILSGRLRQATGGGGGFVPINLLLGPIGLGAITVGLAVALTFAWRQSGSVRPPVTRLGRGIGRGIAATVIGWALAVALDVIGVVVFIVLRLLFDRPGG